MKVNKTFYLEKEILERLNALSKETYIPASILVTLALDEYMSKKEKEEK